MPTSMNVSWTFPNVESGIESITVSIRYIGPCSEGPPPRDIVVTSDARSIIINSLEEFSLYNITVSGSVSSGSPVVTTATATTKTARKLLLTSWRPPFFRIVQITVNFEVKLILLLSQLNILLKK